MSLKSDNENVKSPLYRQSWLSHQGNLHPLPKAFPACVDVLEQAAKLHHFGHKPFLCLLVAKRDFLCFCIALLLLLEFDQILFGLQGSEVKGCIFMIVKY